MFGILRLCRQCSNLLNLRLCKNLSKTNKRNLSESLDVNTNVVKDVILYKYDNPRFFKIVNIFAISQFIFWSYLSIFAYKTLRDAPVDKNPPDEMSWWRRINLGENSYRNTLSGIAFIIGYGILSVSWMFTLRSVRYLILCKGGQNLAFVTYTPFAQNRILTVNLNNVSCQESRQIAKSLLPIKIKGRSFYYVLDMKGEFKNSVLFDHTAGIRRKWKNV